MEIEECLEIVSKILSQCLDEIELEDERLSQALSELRVVKLRHLREETGIIDRRKALDIKRKMIEAGLRGQTADLSRTERGAGTD